MLGTLGAFGIGYVLGARAGKERYEQLRLWTRQALRRLEASGSAESPAGGASRHAMPPRPDGAAVP